MGCVSSNLVAHALRWKDGDLIDKTLIGVEIESEASVVFLDNSASTLLDSLSTNTLSSHKERKKRVSKTNIICTIVEANNPTASSQHFRFPKQRLTMAS
jgi:hypothetical protein